MAYREFYQRQDILVPDYSPLERGVANLFAGIGNANAAKRNDTNKFLDVIKDPKGSYESDTTLLSEWGKGLKDGVMQNNGRLTPELRNSADQMVKYKQISELHKKDAEELYKQLDKFKADNPDYDVEPLKNELIKTANFDVNFLNRGAILDQVRNNLSNPDARNFKINEYAVKYVDGLKKDKFGKDYEGPTSSRSGISGTYKSSKTKESPFIKPDGTVQIDNDDVLRFFKSRDNGMVEKRIETDVKDELLSGKVKEIKERAQMGEDEAKWAKGLKDEQILEKIIVPGDDNVPAKHRVDLNQLKFDKAKDILKRSNQVAEATISGFKADDGTGGNTRVKNKNIQEGQLTWDSENNAISSPGTSVMKDGQPIKTSLSGNKDFFIEGDQISLRRQDGSSAFIPGNTLEEKKRAIRNMSDAEVMNHKPTMSVGVRGFTLNKGIELNNIRNYEKEITDQYADAVSAGDTPKAERLQTILDNIGYLREGMAATQTQNNELLKLAADAGYKLNYKSEIIDNDEAFVKYRMITADDKGNGGIDLKKKENWNDEQKELNKAWEERYNQAVNKRTDEVLGKGQKPPKQETKPKAVKVASQADVDKLAPGTTFIWTDGEEYVKE